MTQYDINLDEREDFSKQKNRHELGYEAPQTYFYTLDASNGFTEENYKLPTGEGGKLSIAFNSSSKLGIMGDKEYADSSLDTYPLLNFDIVCPVK